MTRALHIAAGLAVGALFFPAMRVTISAMAVLQAALTGGW